MVRVRNDGATMATECTPRNNTSPAIRSGIAESSLLAAWLTVRRLDRGAARLGGHGFALGSLRACSPFGALCRHSRLLRNLGFLRKLAWSSALVSRLRLGTHCRLLGSSGAPGLNRLLGRSGAFRRRGPFGRRRAPSRCPCRCRRRRRRAAAQLLQDP